jgi:hypothetical protein
MLAALSAIVFALLWLVLILLAVLGFAAVKRLEAKDEDEPYEHGL